MGDLGGRLARFDAGNKRNAIPRDAEALMFVPKAKLDAATKAVAALNEIVRAELASVEPDLQVTTAKFKGRGKVFKKALQKKLTKGISAMPHGVIKMSADIPGLVETSTNLAVITTSKKDVAIQTSQRSSVASEIVDDDADGQGRVRPRRCDGDGLGRLSRAGSRTSTPRSSRTPWRPTRRCTEEARR